MQAPNCTLAVRTNKEAAEPELANLTGLSGEQLSTPLRIAADTGVSILEVAINCLAIVPPDMVDLVLWFALNLESLIRDLS
jgi:hypothetical protein